MILVFSFFACFGLVSLGANIGFMGTSRTSSIWKVGKEGGKSNFLLSDDQKMASLLVEDRQKRSLGFDPCCLTLSPCAPNRVIKECVCDAPSMGQSRVVILEAGFSLLSQTYSHERTVSEVNQGL